MKPRPRAENTGSKIQRYAEANLECARIITAKLWKYGGPGSLPVLWARLVIDRHERHEQPLEIDSDEQYNFAFREI